jgi:hypothetical protein
MIDNDLTNSEAVSYLLLVQVMCCSALLTGMNGCQRTRDLGVLDGSEQLSIALLKEMGREREFHMPTWPYAPVLRRCGRAPAMFLNIS